MLELQNVHLTLSDKSILKGIHLQAAPGEIVGIMGMNGAGKTSLFRSVFGVYPITQGSITFEGQAIDTAAIAFLETEQFFYNYMKGREYLELIHPQGSPQAIAQWGQVFDLDLEAMTDHYSTGMRKKLAIAGSLLLDKPVMLLDEPFNGLDLESVEVVQHILSVLREKKKAVLISSHVFETLTHCCDKIAALEEGQIQRIYRREDYQDLKALLTEKVKDKFMDVRW